MLPAAFGIPAAECSNRPDMPITYRIFEESDICYAAWTCQVTIDEILGNFRNYLADPAYRLGRTELVDLSGITEPSMHYEELQSLLSVVNAQPFEESPGTLTVVYAPSDATYGLSRMYQTMAGLQKGIILEICRSEAEALSAIGREEKTIAEFLAAQAPPG